MVKEKGNKEEFFADNCPVDKCFYALITDCLLPVIISLDQKTRQYRCDALDKYNREHGGNHKCPILYAMTQARYAA